MMTSITSWLDAINNYNKLEDHKYVEWQELILCKGSTFKVESNELLEETLCLSMESTLRAEVESNMKGLLPNQREAITMLRFIIKRMVIWNQEAWDALKDSIRSFNICNYPGKNVSIACHKLKAVVNVLGPKLPSNAVWTILEGFSKALTALFTQVCATKIAMQGNST
jgi:hypothetical protein